jgi:hypothetical protein
MGRHCNHRGAGAPSIRTRYISGMTRYLRIAAAGFFVLLTLALTGLWIRSYTWRDTAIMLAGKNINLGAGSVNGVVMVVAHRDAPHLDRKDRFYVTSHGVEPEYDRVDLSDFGVLGFSFNREAYIESRGFYVSFPYGFLAASSFALAAIFAVKKSWRFTTRSLLIATTLLALGLGVYFL